MSLPISDNNRTSRLWLSAAIALPMLLLVSIRSHAQIVTANPGEHAILATGNALINETVGKETGHNVALLSCKTPWRQSSR